MRALLSMLLAAASIASGQADDAGTLSGTVSDPSGSSIPNARVTITGRSNSLRRVTSANSSGVYRFSAVPIGDYLVESNAEGFGAAEPQSVRIDAGRPLELNIRLDIPRFSTQVQVTAAGTAQTIDEQSKALDIVDSAQLEHRAEYSIPEGLRTVPGLRVQQFGGPGSLVRVLTRGMRTQDTSVLIDGFRLRDAASPQGDASAFLSDLLVADTNRVEVLRGSGSSLYGTHATGGVINVITDQGGGNFRGDLTAEGGGLGFLRGLAKVSGSALKERLQYTAGFTHLNVLRGLDGNDRTRNSLAHGFAQYQIAPSTTVSGRVMANTSFLQLNSNPSGSAVSSLPPGAMVPAIADVTFTPSLDDPDSSRTSRYFTGLVGLSHNFAPAASMKISYQGLISRRENHDGPGGPSYQPLFNTLDRYDGRIDTLQARTDLRLGRFHTLTAGYEFERETFDNLSQDYNPVPAERVNAQTRIAQRSHSVFAQDQIQMLDRRLQVSLSGRMQSFQLFQPEFSGGAPLYGGAALRDVPHAVTGDASVSYLLPATGTKIRAHVGNGYRAPSLYERFGSSFYFGSFSPYGDPNLRPDRLLAMDAGFDQYLASSKVRVSGTYFYTRIQEAIYFDFSGIINPGSDPYGRFGGYRNTGGGLARGVELSVEANPYRTLTVRSSYTYTKAAERTSALIGGSVRSYRVSGHMFTAVVTQRFGKNMDVTFDLFAASSYIFPFNSFAYLFPGPKKADVSANYTRPISDRYSVRFFTRIENVLNQTYYEEGFRTPGTWATAGMKFLF